MADESAEAVVDAAADQAPASSASSATSLTELPSPDTGAGEAAGDSGEDGETAGVGSDEGGDDDGRLPFDDPETLNAFLDLYGDQLLAHPAIAQRLDPVVQSRVDQTLAKRDELPESDGRYIEASQQEEQVLGGLAAELAKQQRGEDFDPQIVARSALALREVEQRKESLAAQRAATAVISQVTTDMVRAAGRDLFTAEARQAYDDAEQQYNRMHRSGDERTRQRALPEFLHRTLVLVRDAAVEHGRGLERAHATQQTTARDKLQEENVRRQVAAAAAKVRTPSPKQPGGSAKGRPVLDSKTLLAGNWKDTIKLLDAARERTTV